MFQMHHTLTQGSKFVIKTCSRTSSGTFSAKSTKRGSLWNTQNNIRILPTNELANDIVCYPKVLMFYYSRLLPTPQKGIQKKERKEKILRIINFSKCACIVWWTKKFHIPSSSVQYKLPMNNKFHFRGNVKSTSNDGEINQKTNCM